MLDSDLLRWMKTPASQTNDLTAENESNARTNENLFMPVVALALAKKTGEIIERHIPSENVIQEEFAGNSEIEDDADPSPPQIPLPSEDETPQGQEKPLLTPEEEAATWKDYKGVLFDELNKESSLSISNDPGKEYSQLEAVPNIDADKNADKESAASFSEPESDPEPAASSVPSRPEPVVPVTEAEGKNDHYVPRRNIPEKTSADISGNEYISRSFKNRKMLASSLADEFRKNQRIVAEKAGRMRKRRLMLVGVVLFLLIATTTAVSIAFFSYRAQDVPKTAVPSNTEPSVNAADIDGNTNSADAEIPISADSDKISADIANDISADVTLIISADIKSKDEYAASADSDDMGGIKISDDIASPDSDGAIVVTDKVVSGNNGRTGERSVVSSDPSESETDDDGADSLNTANELKTQEKTVSDDKDKIAESENGAESVITESEETTGGTEKTTVSKAERTEGGTRRRRSSERSAVERSEERSRPLIGIDDKNRGSSVKLRGKESPKSGGQNKIYSAIKNENYAEAVNLSKINLESNSEDKLSFFSLGVALYAMSDFSGAAKAFDACFKFSDPDFPNYMVEEFDSADSLQKEFMDYPGVDLLIKAIKLNPRNRSLYLNLFLSNLKSEEPKMASEIYSAILVHANKYAPNTAD